MELANRSLWIEQRGPRYRRPRSDRAIRPAGRDGLEYVVDERDGLPYFYDLNALSNFVADAPEIMGFDPFENLVDLIERAEQRVKVVPDD